MAKCGRPSFGENTVNKKYNSRYRNADNKNKLGGKLLELGRAAGIVAMALYGFDVSLEAASTNERERIFRSAAWYALADEDVEEIFSHDRVHVDDYIKGIENTGIRLYKYEAAEEARKIFQNEVFAPLVEDPVLQMHLALKPGQRVQSQYGPFQLEWNVCLT